MDGNETEKFIKKKPTIVEIAKTCGVSIKTVSRVINHDSNVSPKTRERIEAVISDLGYQTNAFASGLRSGKSNIVLVFMDKNKEEYLSEWHSVMLGYLFRDAAQQGLNMIMSLSDSKYAITDNTDGFSVLTKGFADGAILLENVPGDSRIEYFQKHNIPFVLFGEPSSEDICSVSLDNYQIGFTGGLHLLEKGYRNIAFFVGERDYIATKRRIEGFRAATNNAEGVFEVFQDINSAETAYIQAKNLLAEKHYDAFFVAGDERAIGVYRAANELGYSIPKDIGVLGVNNIPACEYYLPQLTTIEQDFERMSRECMDLLIRQIRGEEVVGSRVIRFQPRIIEREST